MKKSKRLLVSAVSCLTLAAAFTGIEVSRDVQPASAAPLWGGIPGDTWTQVGNFNPTTTWIQAGGVLVQWDNQTGAITVGATTNTVACTQYGCGSTYMTSLGLIAQVWYVYLGQQYLIGGCDVAIYVTAATSAQEWANGGQPCGVLWLNNPTFKVTLQTSVKLNPQTPTKYSEQLWKSWCFCSA